MLRTLAVRNPGALDSPMRFRRGRLKSVDIRTVQELLGHADIRMTLRYSHLSPAHLLDAVEKLTEPQTGTTTGTSTAVVDSEHRAPVAKQLSDRGNRRAIRRNRTGDLLITNCDSSLPTVNHDELSPRNYEEPD